MTETIRTRADIPDQYKWNAASVYPTDAAWEEEADSLLLSLEALKRMEGSVGKSAATLARVSQGGRGKRPPKKRLYSVSRRFSSASSTWSSRAISVSSSATSGDILSGIGDRGSGIAPCLAFFSVVKSAPWSAETSSPPSPRASSRRNCQPP